jgi:hypothetical protein
MSAREKPRCGGPDGKVMMTKEEAAEWLKAFRARYGNKGHTYWCAWSGATPHYHHTKAARRGGRRG